MTKTEFMKKILSALFVMALFIRLPIFSSELFLLPQDSEQALSAILRSIDNSKKSIKITIYNFTHKKIANRLKTAAKRGVRIEIIFDAKSTRSDRRRSMFYYLAKYKNISVYKLKGKLIKKQNRHGIMHLKSALFDHKKVIFGSANWTYSAFGKNYEMIYVENNYAIAKRFEKYFKKLKEKSKVFK